VPGTPLPPIHPESRVWAAMEVPVEMLIRGDEDEVRQRVEQQVYQRLERAIAKEWSVPLLRYLWFGRVRLTSGWAVEPDRFRERFAYWYEPVEEVATDGDG
jgi:hypothetical protein